MRKRRTYRHLDLSRGSSAGPSLEAHPHGVSLVALPNGTFKIRCRGTGCTFSIDGLGTLADAEKMARLHLFAVSGGAIP